MRDPLRNVSVRYKLAFSFLIVCLLAFGVGGFLVSRSARASLEHEIMSLLGMRSQVYAAVFEGELRVLGERARDFASDGYIRTRFTQLQSAESRVEREPSEAALRRHVLRNKLPLESAFTSLALGDRDGNILFSSNDSNEDWTRALPLDAFGDGEWYSGLVGGESAEVAPHMVLSTPLFDIEHGTPIGSLLILIDTRPWIEGSLARAEPARELQNDASIELIDGDGRSLRVVSSLAAPVPASIGPVRSTVQLRAGERRNPGMVKSTLNRGTLSQGHAMPLNGWTLETSMETRDALAAVSGLQARFLLVGVALTLIACVVLLFPMRFLVRPLQELRDATLNIQHGDFGARVPVDSADEIGDLSLAFNEMARSIEKRSSELSAAATSLAQRKDELRRERDRLNTVISSMRDGLMVLDSDGEPEVWNSAAEPLRHVLTGGSLELRAHRDCHQVRATSRTGGADPCLKCLFDPTTPPRSCLVDVGRQAYEIHSTRISPGSDGRAGRVLVARDVTDRVAQDDSEMHQERLAVLGEVAAVVAHELNNPLTSISMFAQMIASKLPEESPLAEDVAVIVRNTQTCSRTIRELLDYATGAAPEVGPVDIHSTLRDVASFLRAMCERHGSEFDLALDAEFSIVIGDEIQLREVFVNIVLNAVQAVAEIGTGRISVSTKLDATHLVIDISDTGPGISQENATAIFKPFFTTKPRGRGTGLGLPTARRITEIQGGGLELVDRRPGHTTFRVRLLRDTT